MKYIAPLILLFILNSCTIVPFPKKKQQNYITTNKIVNKDGYLTYENPVIDKYFFENDVSSIIEEQLLETCKTFKYGSITNRTANNKIVGEKERIGNCFDYAVHFVWNWNKKYFAEMPAFLIIYSNNDENTRGYYSIYRVIENNTKYKGIFGDFDDFHYYSIDGKEIYYGKKVDDIKVTIKENHAWVIIMTQFYQIVVDPQETDHLGYSKHKFYYN
ncbi:MAG: hypothetical protein LBH97_07725 [Treponema sp.]|jgi:hypothetical protein|nr:hypothetical protein [Treponema sp.]